MGLSTYMYTPIKPYLLFLILIISTNAVAAPPIPNQLPFNSNVISGQVAVTQSNSVMSIYQSTDRAAIDWQSFNIGSLATVNVLQPTGNSILLNQVLSSNPTQIFGHLNSNGQLFITNSNGIYFSPSASVNVGGLVATTNTISSHDFLAGLSNFNGNSTPSSVVNDGNLQSKIGGYIALLAPNVRNNGVIVAQMGTVLMASGNQYALTFAGSTLSSIIVSPGLIDALVTNGGAVLAPGGLIILSAQSAHQIQAGIIGNTGVLDASGITSNGGVIELLASQSINVGGSLRADAASQNNSNGGTVLIISDLANPSSQTNITGTIFAQGGTQGGSGGLIETSGNKLTVSGSAVVNTLSTKGLVGNWIIDPNNFVIDSVLNGGDITSAILVNNLLSSNITVLSSNGHAGNLGDIQVNQPINWAGATTLTLNAIHDVVVNSAITANTAGASLSLIAGHDIDVNSTISSIGAVASLQLSAGNNVNINSGITGTAANTSIVVTAGQNVTSVAPIHAVAANSSIAITAGNDVSIGGAITATAQSTTVNVKAGLDIATNAEIIAVAASSAVNLTAGRDITTSTTAAITAGAATTQIALNAGRNISINSAITASPAGSSIQLVSGLAGTGPGISSGTVSLFGAVASPQLMIRFNPDGYAATSADIALYPALADAKAWVYAVGSNKVYDGTASASLQLSGNPSVGGNVNLLPGQANFNDKNTGIAKTVIYSGYSLIGSNASNYALFTPNGSTSATITPKPLTITAVAANKTYDGTTSASVFLTDQIITGDTVIATYKFSTFSDANVGIGKSISVSGVALTGADSSNYSISSSASTTANIETAPLTVTASNFSKNFGQTAVLSAFTQSGLMNNETIEFVTLTSSGVSSSAGVSMSPYLITPSNASGGSFDPRNYKIQYVNGLLVVQPIGLLITVADAWKPFGTTMVLTAFTMNGLVNGDTVGAISESSPGSSQGATVEGSPYAITPGIATGGTFNSANYVIKYVNGTLEVLPNTK